MIRRMTPATAHPIALLLTALAFAACRPATPEQQSSVPAQSSTARDSVPPPLGGPSVLRPSAKDTGESAAGAIQRPSSPGKQSEAPLTPIPQKARREAHVKRGSETLSVSALLAHPMPRGQRVVVIGSCLDQFRARGSAGAPPMTRSDWQIAEGNQVIYVVGRYPSACSAGQVTLSAITELDTITVGSSRRLRQYLVVQK